MYQNNDIKFFAQSELMQAELTQDEINNVNGGLVLELVEWAVKALIQEIKYQVIPPQIF